MTRRFASRKFTLAAWLLVIALPVLVWFGKIDAAVFADCLKWVFGLYAAGNVASKVPEALAGKPEGGAA